MHTKSSESFDVVYTATKFLPILLLSLLLLSWVCIPQIFPNKLNDAYRETPEIVGTKKIL